MITIHVEPEDMKAKHTGVGGAVQLVPGRVDARRDCDGLPRKEPRRFSAIGACIPAFLVSWMHMPGFQLLPVRFWVGIGTISRDLAIF